VRLATTLVLIVLTLWTNAQPADAVRSSARLTQAIHVGFRSQSGAAVVLDVTSGKILAEHNLELAAHRLAQPGSTVKPFLLMALLESGKLKPQERLICRRPLYIGGRQMDCTHPRSITDLDAVEAIAYSCNSYFSKMALRLSAEELTAAFHKAGFDSPTGLATQESSGQLVRPQDQGELQLQALGHYGIQVTALELLNAYRGLALRKYQGNLGIDKPVFDGMEASVLYGMGHNAQPAHGSAAGKTGTASGTNTPATHGFFVGYAPADKPEIVVMVYLEHGRGMDAASVAKSVFSAYFQERGTQ
jgi:cell division protein FtsI/penicillin-binding protein 2